MHRAPFNMIQCISTIQHQPWVLSPWTMHRAPWWMHFHHPPLYMAPYYDAVPVYTLPIRMMQFQLFTMHHALWYDAVLSGTMQNIPCYDAFPSCTMDGAPWYTEFPLCIMNHGLVHFHHPPCTLNLKLV